MRAISWIVKYKTNWLIEHRTGKPSNNANNCLTPEIIQKTILLLCILAQRESFKSSASKEIKDPKLVQLRPTYINEVLCVGGRLVNANLPTEAKHQIILPQKHRLSKLIVQHHHEENLHAGREHTLSLVREKYWIVKGKSVVRTVINECLLCEKRRITPIPPLMADLPKERLATNEPAFSYTGVDYFGPMFVKLNKSTRSNQRTSKRYGVLFTCLTIRAVHLELANDLSTDSFLLAFRRFCSRRGRPKLMWSDNGTNFVGADKELRQAIKSMDKQAIAQSRLDVTWKFNPPSSPWMGGAWEILVKIVKKALKTIVADRVFAEESLLTFLCEVESMVNSRPLTPVSEDSNDMEALTPNHFLINRRNDNTSPGVFNDNELGMRRKWRSVQAATQMFWGRFIKEYLPSLNTRSKWYSKQKPIKLGDMVLIKCDSVPRGSWPLARVIELCAGKDEVIRTVKIRSGDKEFLRPVQKLCVLENCREK